MLYLPVFYIDFRFFSRSLPGSTLNLLLFLAAVKLLTRDRDRDVMHLFLISFGAVLCASLMTMDVTFLFCLTLFLITALNSLVLLEMTRGSAKARQSGMIRPLVAPRNLRDKEFVLFSGFPIKSLALLALALASSVTALAIPLFLILPRVMLGAQPRLASVPGLLSGFSETVELGVLGNIQESNAPVMKVRVDLPSASLPAGLKWRGIALERFDGRSWSRNDTAVSRIPTEAGYFKVQQTTQGADILVQNFYLEPLATDVVFGSHKVLAVSTDLGWVERDASDNLFVRGRSAGTSRYTAVSDITRPDPMLFPDYSAESPRDVAACCLDVPPLDPRIGGVARTVTASVSSPYRKARALEAYLRTAYAYSLELKGTPRSPDPLAMFLFEVRSGHCEYFATAMAVMLRELGIPARLVNGFQVGEYNPLSNHWTVLQRDAHSWVEAYLPPYGWVEFDPTPTRPPESRSAFLSAVSRLFDALDLWWTADLLNFDFRKQARLVSAARASLQGLRQSGRELAGGSLRRLGAVFNGLRSWRPAVLPAALIVVAAAAVLLSVSLIPRCRFALRRFLRLICGSPVRFRTETVVRLYEEALECLRRRGRERAGSQTPLEFSRELAGEAFGETFSSFTTLYNRVRFGRDADEGDIAKARELLRSLRRPIRRDLGTGRPE